LERYPDLRCEIPDFREAAFLAYREGFR